MKKIFLICSLFFALNAFNKAQAQLFPTNLEITVLDDKGNVQPDAIVKIYGSEEDYKNDENVVNLGKTNDKGEVKFKKLEEKVYFIRAQKGEMDNELSANKTGKLEPKRNNMVNVIIEGLALPKN